MTTSPREQTTAEWVAVHNVVFPVGGDSTVLPLYVDEGSGTPAPTPDTLPANQRQLFGLLRDSLHAEVRGSAGTRIAYERRGVRLEPHTRISFATYFNAFPAAYWQEHTDVDTVRLIVDIQGSARIDLFRSNARGKYVRIESRSAHDGRAEFEFPLRSFGDGGWLWFDLETDSESASMSSADWSVPVRSRHRGPTRLTVAIPSFNMPDACLDQIRRFDDHPETMDVVRRVVIVDQGTRRLRETPGFEATAARLGERLEVIEQANLGGSGGFSRGMAEMLADDASDAVLLLDDDAEAEPESVIRAARFNDFARQPLIVGGHMLNANARTVLHSFGETLNFDSFWWEPVDRQLAMLDFRNRSIRTTPSLSKRIDVAYNGWWMCLVPREVVERIGLSLPLFIKWDDAEYSLRASAAGIGTVSLPGMAAWHVPWDEKDDGLDWQAYFHQRNRWVAALLHSPHRRGGSLVRKSFASDLKHLLSMQYTASRLRGDALTDVLSGPRHMDGTLASSAARARRIASEMRDGALITERSAYPPVVPHQKGVRNVRVRPQRNIVTFVVNAIRGIAHQLRPIRATRPQDRVRSVDAKWWRLSGMDVALVGNAAGSGVWEYRRDRTTFRRELRRSIRSHVLLYLRWNRVSSAYRADARNLASPERWWSIFRNGDEA
ncbi:glycosyltransferase [Microbacterium arborescens]|uniref:glycosyltransferase n=1 Tax=Microbacterium arborescens TaxID=33883 RepID=UPI003C77F041